MTATLAAVLPIDQAARTRIGHDHARTLFVEAGAGSGKTTALVERVVELVVTGQAELASVAAITFTEKAGAELRDRLRRALEQRAARDDTESAPGPGAGPAAAVAADVVAVRCRLALDQLDGAAIGTVHAFARRLLAEHPIEAGLPPRVDVLDEVSSTVEFDARWAAGRERLFADPDLERTLLLLLAAGVRPAALDALARAFENDWDLVAERVAPAAPEAPPVHQLLEPALAGVEAVCAQGATCRDPLDRLAVRLAEIEAYAAGLRSVDDEVDLVALVGSDPPVKPPSFKVGNCGRKQNWADVEAVRRAVVVAGEQLEAAAARVAQACAHRLGAAVRAFTLAGAEQRRAAGRLEFHDLLVLARSLLRDPVHGAAVRRRLHGRYTRLLLDEFQDTDPIQIDIAVRIAAAEPASSEAGSLPWPEVPVAPGHLFVVGDPKQSIYRFRRADLGVFLAARDRLGGTGGGEVVSLTTNFRTVAPVVSWVNDTFAALTSSEASFGTVVDSQATFGPLHPQRTGPPVGPAVSVVGRASHPLRTPADTVRASEAAEIAATVVGIVADGWSVGDGSGGWRPARLGDVTILVPARTSLPFLQEALAMAGVPYRAEASSLVYATRAVRDLLMVLRAAGDPSNELHVVAALRTPLLGCGDDDLFRFRVGRGGQWHYLDDQPDTVPAGDPVRLGLAYLRRLHDVSRWRSPSELLDLVARDRRALELGFAEGRPRDVWRRLRFVIDQARAWSDATHGGLRQYLHWVELQSGEGARVAEAVLPETDDDAVRIMTIHASKGLEFPITVLSGLSTRPQNRPAAAQVVFPAGGGVGYRVGRAVQTEEYQAWKPIDEQMAADERIRLLYVAATRARDHLVVSLHRPDRASPAALKDQSNAELLVSGMGSSLAEVPDGRPAGGEAERVASPLPAHLPAPVGPLAEWIDARDRAIGRAEQPSAVAATALADDGGPDHGSDEEAGLQKRPRDQDLPPWLKGRYGTAVGRAVHGTLQTIDLATGAGLDAAVAAQCEAEAIPERAGDVRALVGAALRAPSVRAAAGTPHWREVYACTPLGDRLLEGYVDLLYRGGEGLVVVDYKTAPSADPAELDRRVHGYRLQGGSYALAVAQATGEPVERVTFLFLTPAGPVERALPDLAAVIDEVRALVQAGKEVLVDEA